jgi:hypothetical protein
MNSYREYTKKFKEIVPTSLSCIPQVISNDPYDYVKKLFIQSIRNDRKTTKVTIIDPYIILSDVSRMAELFGGYDRISLEVISKFDSAEKEKSETKEERKNKIKETAERLCRNSIFREISFFQTTEQMHDRYIIVWDGDIIVRSLAIGGSLAQNFEKYISIIEITDKSFEQCLLSYLLKLKSNVCENF